MSDNWDEEILENEIDNEDEFEYKNTKRIPYKEITINGIYHNEIKFLSHDDAVKIIQCDYCEKYYTQQMIAKDYDCEICFHCLFWTNYSIEQRQLVDAVYGKTIVEYVLECKDNHNIETCQRNISGGCFVCDFLNGNNIDNIICEDALKTKNKFDDNEEIVINIELIHLNKFRI